VLVVAQSSVHSQKTPRVGVCAFTPCWFYVAATAFLLT